MRRSSSVSATVAQNNFGEVLSRVSAGETVYITRYDRTTAVVISMEQYRELVEQESADLVELTREFDAMLTRMQSAGTAAGFDALFEMDAGSLGEAAVRGARDDGD